MCQSLNLGHYVQSNNFDILPVELGFVDHSSFLFFFYGGDHLSIKMNLKLHVNIK